MKGAISYINIFTMLIVIVFCSKSIILAEDSISTIIIGEDVSSGPMFKAQPEGGQGALYPGKSITGRMRVKNSRDYDIHIRKLAMNIFMTRDGENLDSQDSDAKDYLNKMKIRVKQDEKIDVCNTSFDEFQRGVKTNIIVGSKDSTELLYTVTMDQSAEVNIAGIGASMDFTLQVEGDQTSIGGGSDDDDDDDSGDYSEDDNKDAINAAKIERVKRPQEVMPKTGGELEKHWAKESMEYMIKEGILKGYPDGTIRPNQNITRAEVAEILVRILHLAGDVTDQGLYTDDIPRWARQCVYQATNEGIFVGYLDHTFRPNRHITREEFTGVICRAFHVTWDGPVQLRFKDKNKIGNWIINDVKKAVGANVIGGYPDGKFRPLQPITRAEVSSIIYRILTER